MRKSPRQEESPDVDLVAEFPREQTDGLPPPVERTSIFTYVPATPADPGVVPDEPATRWLKRPRLRGDDYLPQASFQSIDPHQAAGPNGREVRDRVSTGGIVTLRASSVFAGRAALDWWQRVVAASVDGSRRFAARAHASWRDAVRQPLRAALSTVRFREIIFSCAAVALVAAQTGGVQTGGAQIGEMHRLESQPSSVRSFGTIARPPDSSTPRPIEVPVSPSLAPPVQSATSVATPALSATPIATPAPSATPVASPTPSAAHVAASAPPGRPSRLQHRRRRTS